MANLLWKTSSGTKSLLPMPFKTEAEFEEMMYKTPEIFGYECLIAVEEDY